MSFSQNKNPVHQELLNNVETLRQRLFEKVGQLRDVNADGSLLKHLQKLEGSGFSRLFTVLMRVLPPKVAINDMEATISKLIMTNLDSEQSKEASEQFSSQLAKSFEKLEQSHVSDATPSRFKDQVIAVAKSLNLAKIQTFKLLNRLRGICNHIDIAFKDLEAIEKERRHLSQDRWQVQWDLQEEKRNAKESGCSINLQKQQDLEEQLRDLEAKELGLRKRIDFLQVQAEVLQTPHKDLSEDVKLLRRPKVRMLIAKAVDNTVSAFTKTVREKFRDELDKSRSRLKALIHQLRYRIKTKDASTEELQRAKYQLQQLTDLVDFHETIDIETDWKNVICETENEFKHLIEEYIEEKSEKETLCAQLDEANVLLDKYNIRTREERANEDDDGSHVKKRTLSFHYASNIQEDWELLEELLKQGRKKKPDLLILSGVFGNPLDYEEQCAYNHAYRHVKEAFEQDTTFADVQQFINSFRIDPSTGIVAASARKILRQIEEGKEVLRKRVNFFKQMIAYYDVDPLLIPGAYENLELIKELDEDVASYYLSVATRTVNDVKILGVGGQVVRDENGPLYFQNRDYIDGTEQANQELDEYLHSGIHILASYTPIRYFTDSVGEEENVRKHLCDFLPGNVILTAQGLLPDPKRNQKTATDAILIRGGNFGRPQAGMPVTDRRFGYYWEIKANEDGVIHKRLGRV
jgi:hypothetical protein